MAEFKLKPEISSISHVEFISKLFSARTQLHIFHLLTDSFAKHKTLNGLYDNILEKTDELAETIQGKLLTNLKGFKNYPFVEGDDKIVPFIKDLISVVQGYRKTLVLPKWSNIDNQCQTIEDDLEQTLYLLTLK